ncbi:MAG: RidA family protein [Alphaproteobacteria bacterium]|jgi:enamine deaminase RidA (YjgF/YER057c/UK114 family)|nr:RidA family protein [Alphaproteobacteria bacterium]MDP6831023.1 RidA family protein [Alphaproteobacteria bacterium]MDP6873539.1 RidA family protein [Alphaproteobacteria bacterium]
MAGAVEARLEELNISLPEAPAPAANYVPYVRTGDQVFVSGQVPWVGSERNFVGKVGAEFSIEDGQAAARVVALNIIAQVRAACDGDLDRVVRCVKLGGFVNCTPDFINHPQVINGASDLMVEIFGDAGRHARFAVGAPALPFDVAVEIDAVFEVK